MKLELPLSWHTSLNILFLAFSSLTQFLHKHPKLPYNIIACILGDQPSNKYPTC